MLRTTAIRLTVIIAVITALGPVLLAILFAQWQGTQLEKTRALELANEVFYRSDRTVAQMRAAIDELERADFPEPCDDNMLFQLRRLGLLNEYVLAVGYAVGDIVYCSTFGPHSEGLDLGPVDLVAERTGSLVRLDVRFPVEELTDIFALQRGNFIALAHRNYAIDLIAAQEGVRVATFTPGVPGLRTSSPGVDPRWTDALGDEDHVVFTDGGYLVAVTRSSTNSLTVGIAAIPVGLLNQSTREFIIFLLPLGLLAGGLLAFCVLFIARQQTSLHTEIRMALKRDEFFLVYQPVVDMDSGHWIGAEALIRWHRRDGGVSMPESFIPYAEGNGLIGLISQRVIEMATRDLDSLMQADPDFMLSINLSARDLTSSVIQRSLQSMLEKTALKPQHLMVEITEQSMLHPDIAKRSVQALQQKGVLVAIDDFGTGYSSLSYLETIRFNCLKIDRLFVEAIGTDAPTHGVVLHIIDIAKTLGLRMVAEGVETQAQADFLRGKGIRFAQGWLYSPALDLPDFLKGQRSQTSSSRIAIDLQNFQKEY